MKCPKCNVEMDEFDSLWWKCPKCARLLRKGFRGKGKSKEELLREAQERGEVYVSSEMCNGCRFLTPLTPEGGEWPRRFECRRRGERVEVKNTTEYGVEKAWDCREKGKWNGGRGYFVTRKEEGEEGR